MAYISQPEDMRFVAMFPLAALSYLGLRRASLCACKSGSPTIAGLIRYTLLPFNQSPRASVEPGTADKILIILPRAEYKGPVIGHTHRDTCTHTHTQRNTHTLTCTNM